MPEQVCNRLYACESLPVCEGTGILGKLKLSKKYYL
jgi:hypothetical protein